jgi:hypothetical protein
MHEQGPVLNPATTSQEFALASDEEVGNDLAGTGQNGGRHQAHLRLSKAPANLAYAHCHINACSLNALQALYANPTHPALVSRRTIVLELGGGHHHLSPQQ